MLSASSSCSHQTLRIFSAVSPVRVISVVPLPSKREELRYGRMVSYLARALRSAAVFCASLKTPLDGSFSIARIWVRNSDRIMLTPGSEFFYPPSRPPPQTGEEKQMEKVGNSTKKESYNTGAGSSPLNLTLNFRPSVSRITSTSPLTFVSPTSDRKS